MANPIEAYPLCGQTSCVRPKLVLIDEAWIPAPGKDPRLAYFADLRVDDVRPENLHQPPLEQFIEGFFCDRCNKGFVSEEILKAARRRYLSLANWYGVKVQRNVTLLHRRKTTIRHPTKLQKSGDVEHPMKTTKLAVNMDRRKAFREASGTRWPMSPSSHYSYLVGVMIFWVAWLVYAALGKAYRSEMRWGTFIAEEGSAALAGQDSEGPSHPACPRHGTVVARFDGARRGPGRALTP